VGRGGLLELLSMAEYLPLGKLVCLWPQVDVHSLTERVSFSLLDGDSKEAGVISFVY